MKTKQIALLLSATSFLSISWSLPAPKYLSVPHWKSCTNIIVRDTAKFVCLPSIKPAKCPSQSWKELTKQQLIEGCNIKSTK